MPLKSDFNFQEAPRLLKDAEFVGYQGENYWLLSPQVNEE